MVQEAIEYLRLYSILGYMARGYTVFEAIEYSRLYYIQGYTVFKAIWYKRL